jgi:hypothetical protein
VAADATDALLMVRPTVSTSAASELETRERRRTVTDVLRWRWGLAAEPGSTTLTARHGCAYPLVRGLRRAAPDRLLDRVTMSP